MALAFDAVATVRQVLSILEQQYVVVSDPEVKAKPKMPADWYQAYQASLKIGRQELIYGDERLIGAFGWNNIGRVFDAAKLRSGEDCTARGVPRPASSGRSNRFGHRMERP